MDLGDVNGDGDDSYDVGGVGDADGAENNDR